MSYNQFTEVVNDFSNRIQLDKNYDLCCRYLRFGNKKAAAFFVDGMLNTDLAEKLIRGMQSVSPDNMPDKLSDFFQSVVSHIDSTIKNNVDEVITSLFSGMMVIYIEGYNDWIAIDTRSYPARSVSEPEKDKVLRGSRDGFVETLNFNMALIRRRIRSTELCSELMSVGRSSKTDVAICYMSSRVDTKLLDDLKKRITSIKADALTMNYQSLAECLYNGTWFNPLPKVKYSERPDTAAASILKGNIVIIIDNSPSVMILPTSLFDIVEEANDYYFPPITGNYLRLSRFLVTMVTVFLSPIFLLLIRNPQWIPKSLEFIQIQEQVNIPVILQFIILELCIDGLRVAAMNTPSILTTPLSIIAALVFGEFSVKSGWFNSEVMLYMAFVAVGNYSQASYEFGYALKFMRILLLVLVQIFGLWGFIGGCVFVLLLTVFNKTISGKRYLYPLIPFNWCELKNKLFRVQRNIDNKETKEGSN